MTADSDPRTILLFGGTGQIGFELVRALRPFGAVVAPGRSEVDLSVSDSIRASIRHTKPTLIVNAAGYTDVDGAELNRSASFALNAGAPGVLAEEAHRCRIPILHYSSDYVFDGAKRTPYVETDRPNPLNVYGESKLAGDEAVLGAGGAGLVLRVAWVYGMRRRNFLRAIMDRVRSGQPLRVVDDQVGTPSWSRSIAELTVALVASLFETADQQDVYERAALRAGIYHVASRDMTSRWEFADAVVRHATQRDGLEPPLIERIATKTLALPADRPEWSVMGADKLYAHFNVRLPSWRAQLAALFSGAD